MSSTTPAPEGSYIMTMTPGELAALREYYDTTDTAEEMTDESGRWEADAAADPMVTTSLRLPRSLLTWVRDQAAAEQVKPTALIRRWIEDRRRAANDSSGAGGTTLAELVARVERLESVTLHVLSHSSSAEAADVSDDDSMTDLLTALQRSVEAAKRGGWKGGDARPGSKGSSRERRGA